MPLPITVALLARKGGTGKTTTTLGLAGQLVTDGAKVLCIDLDGQGSLSRVIYGPTEVEALHPALTTAALFDPKFDPGPEDLVRETQFPGLFISPSADVLETFNPGRPAEAGEAQFRVRKFVAEVADRVDFVLIDTGPNTSGLLAWSALAAADCVVCPLLADPFGAQAVIHAQRLVEEVQVKVNPRLVMAGYLINQRKREKIQDAYENVLRQIHGHQVFQAVIPLLAAYREAAAVRQPVTLFKPKSKASKIVKAFADELIDRVTQILLSRKEAA